MRYVIGFRKQDRDYFISPWYHHEIDLNAIDANYMKMEIGFVDQLPRTLETLEIMSEGFHPKDNQLYDELEPVVRLGMNVDHTFEMPILKWELADDVLIMDASKVAARTVSLIIPNNAPVEVVPEREIVELAENDADGEAPPPRRRHKNNASRSASAVGDIINTATEGAAANRESANESRDARAARRQALRDAQGI